MNPIALRPTPPAATTPVAAPECAATPGFAALLDAAREPAASAEPAAPAEGDPPESGTTDRPDERATRARPKPHAPVVKGRRQDTCTEPAAAINVAALLQAQPAPTEPSDAVPDAVKGEQPPLTATDPAAAPLPTALPTPPVALAETMTGATADGAPDDRELAAPTRGAREASNAASSPLNSPDAPSAAPALATSERHAAAAVEALPGMPAKADALHHAPAPSPTEGMPSAIGLAAPQASTPLPAPATTAAAPFSAHLAAALESPAFAPALATQVRWLVEGGVQTAQLTLNPAEMGPVAVRIAVDGTQARIDFAAEFATTRAAIEASLPTLAAALAEGGLTLAGGGVFDGSSPRHSQPDAQGAGRLQPTAAGAGSADGPARAQALPARARGLVDLVA